MPGPRWIPLGDAALLAPRPPGLDARALSLRLRACPGVVDVVVTEDRVGVHFEPGSPPPDLDAALARAGPSQAPHPPRELTIAVRYDGPDLAEVAARVGLPPDEVARVHAAGAYEVRMVGFLPGFAYLGGLDPRLVVPRRPEPRPRVPPGALAIAAGYTAVYPFASPGGWSLIGHAVDAAFFGDDGPLLELGDRVRFRSVA